MNNPRAKRKIQALVLFFPLATLILAVRAEAQGLPPTDTPDSRYNACVSALIGADCHKFNAHGAMITYAASATIQTWRTILLYGVQPMTVRTCVTKSGNMPISDDICNIDQKYFTATMQTQSGSIDSIASLSDKPPLVCGSILDLQSRSVGEVIPLSGLPFSLVYDGKNDPARRKSSKINYAATFYTGSGNIQTVRKVEIWINNTLVKSTEFPALPALQYSDYAVDSWFTPPNPFVTSGTIELKVVAPTQFGSSVVSLPVGNESFRFANYKPSVWGLGGWTLSNHHYYDRQLDLLFLGSGGFLRADSRLSTIAPYGDVDLVANENGSEVYIFDSLGRHRETRTPLLGRTKWKFDYLPDSKISKITDGDGRTIDVLRDGSGNITAIRNSYGVTTVLTVNSKGRLDGATDATGAHYQFTYNNDGSGLLSSIQYPNSLETNFTYDDDGQLVAEAKNTGGVQTIAEILIDGKIWSLIETAEGVLRKFLTEYDGTSKSQEKDAGDQLVSATKKYPYDFSEEDQYFTLKRSDDPDDRFSSVRFPSSIDVSNRLTGQKYASITQSQNVTYTSGTGPFSIDQMKTTITSNGNTTESLFIGPEKRLQITSPLGRTSSLLFDERERPTRISNPGGLDTELTYNSFGQLSRVKRGAQYLDLAYSSQGYLESETTRDGQVTTYQRDANGRVLRKTQPNGDRIDFAYNPSGALKEIKTPQQQIHRFEMNLLDSVTSYLPPSLGGGIEKTVYDYDRDNRLSRIRKPSGAEAIVEYKTGTKFISTIQTGNGSYTFQDLDTGGRPVSATSPDEITTNVQWLGDSQEQVTWSDGSGILGSVKMPTGRSFLKTEFTVIAPGGLKIPYQYDAEERLLSAGSEVYAYEDTQETASGTALATSKITSRLLNRIESRTERRETESLTDPGAITVEQRDTEVKDASGVMTASFSLEDRRNLRGLIVTSKGTKSYQGISGMSEEKYLYDANSRLTEVHRKGENGSFALEAKYIFEPGSNGNVKTYIHGDKVFSATYDAQDRLKSLVGSVTRDFSYTADGDLKEISNCTGSKSFHYDIFGNLKKATLKNGDVIEYKTDAQNRRIKRLVNGQLTEIYLWYDQTRLAAVLNADKSVRIQYVYGINPIAPSYLIRAGQTYKIISDSRGSIRFVVDLDGKVAQEIRYDEYGVVLNDSSRTASSPEPFQPLAFAAGIYDHVTRLVRFGARDYDPETGRWTSKDPILFGGGDTNLYGYVMNDPVNFVDPNGLKKTFVFQNGSLSFYDDNGGLLFEGPAGSGPWGNGSLPKGNYSVGDMRDNRSGSYACSGSNGYSLDLHPQFSTNRTDLRIHPDGGRPGTLGCIGVGCGNGAADALGEMLRGIYNQPMTPWIGLEVR